MIVMAVPNDAAKDSGISSLDAGISFSRESFNMGGSISAVMVTWWVNAESNATDGITTPMARSRLLPDSRLIQFPSRSESRMK